MYYLPDGQYFAILCSIDIHRFDGGSTACTECCCCAMREKYDGN